MEIFEVHITGDEKIIETAKSLNVRTIVIDLVKPDKSYFRTEYMTSHTYRCENYDECKVYVDDIVAKLKEAGVNIVRVKIECPLYPQYRERSLYFEVHYGAYNNTYPLSRNKGKDHFLCTAREYDRSKYDDLARKHLCFLPTMELCLYDTNVEEDKDWFDLYERQTSHMG
jgi:hypothetical protein